MIVIGGECLGTIIFGFPIHNRTPGLEYKEDGDARWLDRLRYTHQWNA